MFCLQDVDDGVDRGPLLAPAKGGSLFLFAYGQFNRRVCFFTQVHFKTLANSVRWMVRGQYRKGITDAVLRAKLAAEGIVIEESSHAHDDRDESDVSMDDAGFDKNNPDEQMQMNRRMERRVLGIKDQGNPGQTLGEIMAGDDTSGKPSLSPNTSWKLWATLQKLGSFGRSKPVNPDTGEPLDRPYTR